MSWLAGILNVLILLVGLFLILLILIQRGKGGGLAGAFGGAGGSSAFGSRAGDTFTRITITVAAVWVLLIMLMVKIVQPPITDSTPVLESPPPGDEDQAQRSHTAPARWLIFIEPFFDKCREAAVLLSMTGYGEANYHSDSLTLAIELRAVNNRYLKVSLRASEPYNLLEPEFEKVIRRTIRRGTVQVHVRVQRQFNAGEFKINATALRGYLAQLRTLAEELELPHHGEQLFAQVLALPGVAPEPGSVSLNLDEEWPVIEATLTKALGKLQAMRQEEGKAMAQELLQLRDAIAQQLTAIRELAPNVVVAYRDRLLERVRGMLAELDVKIDRSDLIKEVSIFGERSDIAEELVRLASHLDQFQEVMNEPESAGRKLEFLGQEMFREANTIGSKASDVAISRHVVEIKAALEKIRELVQNIE